MNTNYSIHKRSFLETSEIIYTFIIAFSASTGTSSVKICRLLVVAAFIMEVAFNKNLAYPIWKMGDKFFLYMCALNCMDSIIEQCSVKSFDPAVYINCGSYTRKIFG